MYCKKCGVITHPEESINYGMCENCYDKYLDSDEEVTIKEFLKRSSN